MKLSTDEKVPIGDLQAQVQLCGTHLDTIVEVSEQLSHMTDLLPLVKLLALAYNVRSPNPSEEHHMNTLMRTLAGDSLDKTTSDAHPGGFSRSEIIQSFSRFLSPVLNGLTGLGDFEKAVGAGEDPAGFRQFWTLEGSNLLSDAMSGIGPLAASAGTEISFLDAFVKDKTRRLALTHDHGALALVPHKTRVGDELLSYDGSLVVVRLRDQLEALPANMTVIGEAYSHGFAQGKPPGGCKKVSNTTEFLTSSVAVGLAGAVPK